MSVCFNIAESFVPPERCCFCIFFYRVDRLQQTRARNTGWRGGSAGLWLFQTPDCTSWLLSCWHQRLSEAEGAQLLVTVLHFSYWNFFKKHAEIQIGIKTKNPNVKSWLRQQEAQRSQILIGRKYMHILWAQYYINIYMNQEWKQGNKQG